jgi:hypothetical protein
MIEKINKYFSFKFLDDLSNGSPRASLTINYGNKESFDDDLNHEQTVVQLEPNAIENIERSASLNNAFVSDSSK